MCAHEIESGRTGFGKSHDATTVNSGQLNVFPQRPNTAAGVMSPATQQCAPGCLSPASSAVSLPTPPTTIRKRAWSEVDRSEVEQSAHKRQRILCTPLRSPGKRTCHGIVLERNSGRALLSPPSSDPSTLPATPTTPRSLPCPVSPRTPLPCSRPIRDTPNNVFLASHPVKPEDVKQSFGVPDSRGEIPVMVYVL